MFMHRFLIDIKVFKIEHILHIMRFMNMKKKREKNGNRIWWNVEIKGSKMQRKEEIGGKFFWYVKKKTQKNHLRMKLNVTWIFIKWNVWNRKKVSIKEEKKSIKGGVSTCMQMKSLHQHPREIIHIVCNQGSTFFITYLFIIIVVVDVHCCDWL